MKTKLLLRIIISYVIFGLCGFIFISAFTAHHTQKKVEELLSSSLRKEASLLAQKYTSGSYASAITLHEYEEQLEAVSVYLEGDVFVLNKTGSVLVSTMNTSFNEQLEGFHILDFSGGNYTISNFYGFYPDGALCAYAPITNGYTVTGYVFICVPMDYITEVRSELLNGSYISLMVLFLISLLVLIVYIFFVQRPLRKLTKAVQNYHQGNYSKPVMISQNDELGYMAATFNYMAQELQTLEDDQRKFVSNISHDFRSPLTSIKGYAQAIADGTIPVEMQDKYLNIIIFETERLEKLTQSLLELNKYGSKGYFLDFSSFDLNHCIKMTVQSFEQISKEKHISFHLILTGDTLYVDADLGRIQQVLQNLIDNAIKFSHHNSSIYIETTVRGDKVFVSVKDYGIGIPRESINKIWDRFYKTDLSRGKDKKGTGLGLAIVKEIISAHKENINVISTEGVGTEFIFTLSLTAENEDLPI